MKTSNGHEVKVEDGFLHIEKAAKSTEKILENHHGRVVTEKVNVSAKRFMFRCNLVSGQFEYDGVYADSGLLFPKIKIVLESNEEYRDFGFEEEDERAEVYTAIRQVLLEHRAKL